MHILIAPNAFKNSLNASDAAVAIREGLMESALDCTCECFPIGDGGDGTGELIIRSLDGKRVKTEVSDPFGRKISAFFGLIEGGRTAVIELAAASGIGLLRPEELNPLRAMSFGTGQQILRALDMGVTKIIICIGGSATVDGGCGILQALGIRFLDTAGKDLSGLPESLIDLGSIDSSGLDKRIGNCELVVLCDVDNRLLGPEGAAAVFGPQKGATPDAVRRLDAALAKLAEVGLSHTGREMDSIVSGGAAGGVAAGLYAFLQAALENGIDYFLKLTGFAQKLEQCDLLITGEGSIDEQTLQGKGPFGVASLARLQKIPVIGLAGKVPLENNLPLQEYFSALFAIGNAPSELEVAMKATAENLKRISLAIGNLLTVKGI